MPHLKNYRGATNYFFPKDQKYRDGWERIWGNKSEEPCTHPDGHDFKGETVGPETVSMHLDCRHCGRSIAQGSK